MLGIRVQGKTITEIIPGTPAYYCSSLHLSDEIVAIDGEPCNEGELRRHISVKSNIGAPCELSLSSGQKVVLFRESAELVEYRLKVYDALSGDLEVLDLVEPFLQIQHEKRTEEWSSIFTGFQRVQSILADKMRRDVSSRRARVPWQAWKDWSTWKAWARQNLNSFMNYHKRRLQDSCLVSWSVICTNAILGQNSTLLWKTDNPSRLCENIAAFLLGSSHCESWTQYQKYGKAFDAWQVESQLSKNGQMQRMHAWIGRFFSHLSSVTFTQIWASWSGMARQRSRMHSIYTRVLSKISSRQSARRINLWIEFVASQKHGKFAIIRFRNQANTKKSTKLFQKWSCLARGRRRMAFCYQKVTQAVKIWRLLPRLRMWLMRARLQKTLTAGMQRLKQRADFASKQRFFDQFSVTVRRLRCCKARRQNLMVRLEALRLKDVWRCFVQSVSFGRQINARILCVLHGKKLLCLEQYLRRYFWYLMTKKRLKQLQRRIFARARSSHVNDSFMKWWKFHERHGRQSQILKRIQSRQKTHLFMVWLQFAANHVVFVKSLRRFKSMRAFSLSMKSWQTWSVISCQRNTFRKVSLKIKSKAERGLVYNTWRCWSVQDSKRKWQRVNIFHSRRRCWRKSVETCFNILESFTARKKWLRRSCNWKKACLIKSSIITAFRGWFISTDDARARKSNADSIVRDVHLQSLHYSFQELLMNRNQRRRHQTLVIKLSLICLRESLSAWFSHMKNRKYHTHACNLLLIRVRTASLRNVFDGWYFKSSQALTLQKACVKLEFSTAQATLARYWNVFLQRKWRESSLRRILKEAVSLHQKRVLRSTLRSWECHLQHVHSCYSVRIDRFEKLILGLRRSAKFARCCVVEEWKLYKTKLDCCLTAIASFSSQRKKLCMRRIFYFWSYQHKKRLRLRRFCHNQRAKFSRLCMWSTWYCWRDLTNAFETSHSFVDRVKNRVQRQAFKQWAAIAIMNQRRCKIIKKGFTQNLSSRPSTQGPAALFESVTLGPAYVNMLKLDISAQLFRIFIQWSDLVWDISCSRRLLSQSKHYQSRYLLSARCGFRTQWEAFCIWLDRVWKRKKIQKISRHLASSVRRASIEQTLGKWRGHVAGNAWLRGLERLRAENLLSRYQGRTIRKWAVTAHEQRLQKQQCTAILQRMKINSLASAISLWQLYSSESQHIKNGCRRACIRWVLSVQSKAFCTWSNHVAGQRHHLQMCKHVAGCLQHRLRARVLAKWCETVVIETREKKVERLASKRLRYEFQRRAMNKWKTAMLKLKYHVRLSRKVMRRIIDFSLANAFMLWHSESFLHRNVKERCRRAIQRLLLGLQCKAFSTWAHRAAQQNTLRTVCCSMRKRRLTAVSLNDWFQSAFELRRRRNCERLVAHKSHSDCQRSALAQWGKHARNRRVKAQKCKPFLCRMLNRSLARTFMCWNSNATFLSKRSKHYMRASKRLLLRMQSKAFYTWADRALKQSQLRQTSRCVARRLLNRLTSWTLDSWRQNVAEDFYHRKREKLAVQKWRSNFQGRVLKKWAENARKRRIGAQKCRTMLCRIMNRSIFSVISIWRSNVIDARCKSQDYRRTIGCRLLSIKSKAFCTWMDRASEQIRFSDILKRVTSLLLHRLATKVLKQWKESALEEVWHQKRENLAVKNWWHHCRSKAFRQWAIFNYRKRWLRQQEAHLTSRKNNRLLVSELTLWRVNSLQHYTNSQRLRHASRHLLLRLQSKTFHTWSNRALEQRQFRQICQDVTNRLLHRFTAWAFEQWRKSVAAALWYRESEGVAARRWRSKCQGRVLADWAENFRHRRVAAQKCKLLLRRLKNHSLMTAFLVWQSSVVDCKEHFGCLRRASRRLTLNLQSKAFCTWAGRASEQRKCRQLCRRVTCRLMRRLTAWVFDHWLKKVAEDVWRRSNGRLADKRWRSGCQKRAVTQWAENATHRRVVTLKCTYALRRIMNRSMAIAFLLWQSNVAECRVRLASMRQVSKRLTLGLQSKAFCTWIDRASATSQLRQLCKRVASRLMNKVMAWTLNQWCENVAEQRWHRKGETLAAKRQRRSCQGKVLADWAQNVRQRRAEAQKCRKLMHQIFNRSVATVFTLWRTNVQKGQAQSMCLKRASKRMLLSAQNKSFCTWADRASEQRELRQLCRRVASRLMHRVAAWVFERWRDRVAEDSWHRESERLAIDKWRSSSQRQTLTEWAVVANWRRFYKQKTRTCSLRMMHRSLISVFKLWQTNAMDARTHLVCLRQALRRLLLSLQSKAFCTWAERASEQKALRQICKRVASRLLHRVIAWSLDQWRENVAGNVWCRESEKLAVEGWRAKLQGSALSNWRVIARERRMKTQKCRTALHGTKQRLRTNALRCWQSNILDCKTFLECLRHASTRLLLSMQSKAFCKWRDDAAEQRRLRQMCRRVAGRLMHRVTARAFELWGDGSAERIWHRETKGLSDKKWRSSCQKRALTRWGQIAHNQRAGAQKCVAILQRMANRLLATAFMLWQSNSNECRAKLECLSHALRRLLMSAQSRAFCTWANRASEQARVQHMCKVTSSRLTHRLTAWGLDGWLEAVRNKCQDVKNKKLAVVKWRFCCLKPILSKWALLTYNKLGQTQMRAVILKRLNQCSKRHVLWRWAGLVHDRRNRLRKCLRFQRRSERALMSGTHTEWSIIGLRRSNLRHAARVTSNRGQCILVQLTFESWYRRMESRQLSAHRRLLEYPMQSAMSIAQDLSFAASAMSALQLDMALDAAAVWHNLQSLCIEVAELGVEVRVAREDLVRRAEAAADRVRTLQVHRQTLAKALERSRQGHCAAARVLESLVAELIDARAAAALLGRGVEVAAEAAQHGAACARAEAEVFRLQAAGADSEAQEMRARAAAAEAEAAVARQGLAALMEANQEMRDALFGRAGGAANSASTGGRASTSRLGMDAKTNGFAGDNNMKSVLQPDRVIDV